MSNEDSDGVMEGLPRFLRAELDEDHGIVVRNLGDRGLGSGCYPDYRTYYDDDTAAADDFIERFDSARMLREIDAKRGLLLIAETALADDPDDQTAQHIASLLVLPYSQHPCYRAGWSMIEPNALE